MPLSIRPRVTCDTCGKTVAVQGSWPDEYVRKHQDDSTGKVCGHSFVYLLAGEDTYERADNWTPDQEQQPGPVEGQPRRVAS